MSQALSIDWTACDGRGLCTELLPELLVADPWGYPIRRGAGDAAGAGAGPVAVPDQLTASARQAVRMCPRLALRLQSTP